MSILAVGLGGALGAISRYGFMSLIGLTNFPYGTLLVNTLGSMMLGAFISANALHVQVSEAMKFFFIIGFLGSFTTFSTFSMDSVFLLQKGDYLKASVYIASSFILSIGCFIFGMYLAK